MEALSILFLRCKISLYHLLIIFVLLLKHLLLSLMHSFLQAIFFFFVNKMLMLLSYLVSPFAFRHFLSLNNNDHFSFYYGKIFMALCFKSKEEQDKLNQKVSSRFYVYFTLNELVIYVK